MKIRFYILIQTNAGLYALWEWASESLPTEDNNVEEILILCRKFLVHKVSFQNAHFSCVDFTNTRFKYVQNLLNQANHYRELAFKKAKQARETYLPEPLTSTKTLDYIKYNNQTPAKPRR